MQLAPNATVLEASKIENVPSINEVMENKPVMNMFKKYVSEDDRETNNLMQLYYDLETYFSITSSKSRKETQALHIVKLYLEPDAKRYVNLDNEQLTSQIAEQTEHPSFEILRDVHSFIMPKVEEIFKEFMLKQSEELGVDPQSLATISQAELTLRLSTEQAMMASWDKKKLKGKGNNRLLRDDDVRLPLHSYSSIGSQSSLSQASMLGPLPRTARRAGKKKATGRAQPTREHKNELLTALNQSAMGHLSIPMLYFYKYLLKHGHEDETPQIDKDLFFYIEVQKFKDCSHSYSDEELLRGKVQSIVDCFLESCYSPALQIDIPMDMHQKALKAAQRYVTGKEITPTLFDEAQIYIFKDLLLYWAGFRRATTRPSDLVKRPVLKYEKMLRRRLENIQNYQAPSSEFTLPSIPEGAVPSFSISLSEGIRFKVYTPPPPPIVRGHTNLTQDESVTGTPQPDGQLRDHKSSKNGLLFTEGSLVRSHNSSRKSSIAAR
uniref:RGS domain-containing protein n=1 Tax=Biomphalaria glabrata TaxID=6526 RepID=A0A2C9LE70_BIOGL